MEPSVTSEFDRNERPIHDERRVRIVCIGAGLSGLCLAYKLQRSFQNFDLTLYEKNESIGGVWFENRYPGVACDIPSHNYVYSFEPKRDHTAEYAQGGDIFQYLIDFAKKYDLEKYCRTGTRVTDCSWDDIKGHWKIQLTDLITNEKLDDEADILVNASGLLNQWKWPTIQGLDDFQGHLVHSANWDESVELEGKRIALIGNGSSGQQLLTAIQPRVSKLVHFIRQPNWITGPFGDAPQDYAIEQIEEFKSDDMKLLSKRKKIESVINSTFGSFLRSSPLQNGMRQFLTQAMQAKVREGGLLDELIPTFAPGCRRPTPGLGYLEALAQPNVEVVIGDIHGIASKGLVDNTGREHDVDVIICATGFDTTHIPSFSIVGLEGKSLQNLWAEDVTDSYFATTVPYMPNYATFFGPFCPSVSGSYVRNIEVQADYILQLVDRYQTENVHSFAPSLDASRAFTAHCRQFLNNTVWIDSCRSHYKSGTTGNAKLSMWPGSSLHFSDALRELRAEDYVWVYSGGDQFAWLGNGFSATGADPTSDLAWYIRNHDDGPLMSRGARRRELALSGSQIGRNELLASQGRTAD